MQGLFFPEDLEYLACPGYPGYPECLVYLGFLGYPGYPAVLEYLEDPVSLEFPKFPVYLEYPAVLEFLEVPVYSGNRMSHRYLQPRSGLQVPAYSVCLERRVFQLRLSYRPHRGRF